MGNITATLAFPAMPYIHNKGRLAFRVAADDAHTTRPTKAISGHVYLDDGTPVVGATVDLYRQSDGAKVQTTTSIEQGIYSFPRGDNDSNLYYTVAYSLVNGAVQIHGASNRGLVPVNA